MNQRTLSKKLSEPIRLLQRVLGWAVLAAALLFAWHNLITRFDPQFRSPFDEHTHFDYWWRIYQQKTLPEVYDRMHHESMTIWGCYAEALKNNPDCSPTEHGPSEHENTASNYPPTFYVATAAMAWVLDLFVKTDNLFHLAKLANLAWGLICVVLVAWLALALKVPLLLTALLVFAVGQTPAFVFSAITLNQEIFVLLFCLAGLIWYVQRTASAGLTQFILETGLLAGICLTVKPTALLLPVIIVLAEMFSTHRTWGERIKRIGGFTFVVMTSYLTITTGSNILRGINPSDGKMRDYLLSFGGNGDWMTWSQHIWKAFTRSTASLHWRTLVDYDLPWLFTRFHRMVLVMTALAIPYVIFSEIRRRKASLSSGLMLGATFSFAILPLALALYLQFSDFPFFFQNRYYTAYIIVATIIAVAFFCDLLRELFAWAIDRCAEVKKRGLCDAN